MHAPLLWAFNVKNSTYAVQPKSSQNSCHSFYQLPKFLFASIPIQYFPYECDLKSALFNTTNMYIDIPTNELMGILRGVLHTENNDPITIN